MKKPFVLILICSLFCFCTHKKSEYEIERENIQHQKDSLSQTDVKLAFMGIEIGGDISNIDSAINKGVIEVDSCRDGIYICKAEIPYIKDDTIKLSMSTFVRIGTINRKVASIELLTRNRDAFHYFRDTYCKRYYDQYKEKLHSFSEHNNTDHFHWQFKNQSLKLYEKTHKDIGEKNLGYNSNLGKNEWVIGEIDVYDGTSIEYVHDSLYKCLIDVATKETSLNDSINKAQKKVEEIKRKKENEKLDREYRNNI